MWVITGTGMPDINHYYVHTACQDHTVSSLTSLVGNSRFAIPYEYGVFDCSEMSAYLDWFLKGHGFKSSICVDRIPSFGTGGHAWLKVEVTTKAGNKTVYVEATSTPIRVYESDMIGYSRYANVTDEFDSIFRFTDRGWAESEIDWWNNVRDIPQGYNMTVRMNVPYTVISESDFPDLST